MDMNNNNVSYSIKLKNINELYVKNYNQSTECNSCNYENKKYTDNNIFIK
ncbi:hypothetical protein I3900191A7_14810 [Clostridium baratii]